MSDFERTKAKVRDSAVETVRHLVDPARAEGTPAVAREALLEAARWQLHGLRLRLDQREAGGRTGCQRQRRRGPRAARPAPSLTPTARKRGRARRANAEPGEHPEHEAPMNTLHSTIPPRQRHVAPATPAAGLRMRRGRHHAVPTGPVRDRLRASRTARAIYRAALAPFTTGGAA